MRVDPPHHLDSPDAMVNTRAERPAFAHVRLDRHMDRQQEFVLRTIEERDIRFVRLWFTDVLGTLKSVAVAPAELEGAFEEGLGFDGSAIEGFSRVTESDMLVKPDPSSFQVLPWRGAPPGTARMFADILLPDGAPSYADPRFVLRRGWQNGWRVALCARRMAPMVEWRNQVSSVP